MRPCVMSCLAALLAQCNFTGSILSDTKTEVNSTAQSGPSGASSEGEQGQSGPDRTCQVPIGHVAGTKGLPMTLGRPLVVPRRPVTCGFAGGAEGTRTPDPHTASVVRYQLRHSPLRSLTLQVRRLRPARGQALPRCREHPEVGPGPPVRRRAAPGASPARTPREPSSRCCRAARAATSLGAGAPAGSRWPLARCRRGSRPAPTPPREEGTGRTRRLWRPPRRRSPHHRVVRLRLSARQHARPGSGRRPPAQ